MHRLFFATVPDAPARAAIERLAVGICEAGSIRGRRIAPDHYHMTLAFLGDHHETEAVALREHACAAAGAMQFNAFGVALDRIATFAGRFRMPCVLRCAPASEAAATETAGRLGAQLARNGVAAADGRRFVPHLTIAYADRVLDAPIAIDPVVWQANELQLVDSHGGRHDIVGRWPLA